MCNLKMGTWDFGKPTQISWFSHHQNIANHKRHQEEEDRCIPDEEKVDSNSICDSDSTIAQYMSQRVNTPNKKTLNYSTFSALPHQPGTTNISFPFPHFLNNQTNSKCNISKPTKQTHIFSFFSCFLRNQTGSINQNAVKFIAEILNLPLPNQHEMIQHHTPKLKTKSLK